MFSKKFTLIELIVVIAILGILAGIIIPNVSNIKEDAVEVALKTDAKNIQTSVDIYSIKNMNSLPISETVSILKPVAIDFEKIIPTFLKEVPNQGYFWLDYVNNVWVSTVDAPTGYSLDPVNKILSWNPSENAVYYNIYGTNLEAGKTNNTIFLLSSQKETNFDYSSFDYSTYLISSVDKYNLETAKVGSSEYKGMIKPSPNETIILNGEMNFDGSKPMLYDISVLKELSKNDFTIEYQVKTSINKVMVLLDGLYNTEDGILSTYVNDNRVCFYTFETKQICSTGTITLNEWNHIAFVRKDDVVNIYINGEKNLTINLPLDYSFRTTSPVDTLTYGGRGEYDINDYNLIGKMANIKINTKEAIYTENFIPLLK